MKYKPREPKAHSIVPVRMTMQKTASLRRPLPDTGEAGSPYMPKSARRYNSLKPASGRVQTSARSPISRRAVLVFCAGILLMVGIYGAGLAIGSLWQNLNDQWTYGNPRTYHTDARVGHGDERVPSHFLAMRLRGQVHVIEFPGGDASLALVYVGPALQGDENAPVTLAFQDVSGDDKVDMLLLVRDMLVGVFLNDVISDVPQFRPVRPDDRIVI